MILPVELSWPPRDCQPNRKPHWAAKARAAKAYRKECHALARQAMRQRWVTVEQVRDALETHGHLDLHLEFYPPDRRPRDDDNLEGAFKAGRDGIADAIGVDDRNFRVIKWLHRDQPRKGGAVLVTITAGQTAAIEMVLPDLGE